MAGCHYQWNTVRGLLLWLLRIIKGLIIREFTLRVSDSTFLQLQHFIIWQDSLEVNPNVLIGSFLVGFCHKDRFHGNGHKPCILCI